MLGFLLWFGLERGQWSVAPVQWVVRGWTLGSLVFVGIYWYLVLFWSASGNPAPPWLLVFEGVSWMTVMVCIDLIIGLLFWYYTHRKEDTYTVDWAVDGLISFVYVLVML